MAVKRPPSLLSAYLALLLLSALVLQGGFWAVSFSAPAVRTTRLQRPARALGAASPWAPPPSRGRDRGEPASRAGVARSAYSVDLTGKVAFIAGVADTSGYGWAIARELANAGATILVGTWPPVLKMFELTLQKSSGIDARVLADGSLMEIAKVYPLDAAYDTAPDVPEEVLKSKRYAGVSSFSVQEVADQVRRDYGKVDILVHSLANGPEVTKPLMETSRAGYLAASSASAYSLVSLTSRFAPLMPVGGSVVCLTYIASERVVPGYGGGMSSAKAQLESDTRTLAWEAGRRHGIRVNAISAGPLKSRAASAIGRGEGPKTFIERAIDYSMSNAPLVSPLQAEDVATTALALVSNMMSSVTGVTLYVDKGLHAMGVGVDSPAFDGVPTAPNYSPEPS